MSLLELVQRRLVIVTGKGGVGKTTLAAAMGRALAQTGKRVLLTEIVPSPETPSSLQAALDLKRAPTEEPHVVDPNLSVALLTPASGHLRFLQDALPLRLLADAAMRSHALRKFLSAAPGFSDMGVMYRMLDLMRRAHPSGGPLFETCIVDSPATGHALALAQIPEFLVRVIPGGPIARAAADGVKVLTDRSVTGCVVVTLPETLPITEALEHERGLAKHHLAVSAIVVNRVPGDPFSSEERSAVQGVIGTDGSVFGSREMRRIERAEAALALLHEKHPQSTVVLSEVEGVGAAVTNNLVPLLSR